MSSILNPICRGLVAYMSYLATCSASTVYTESLLYEPILRIAQSKGFDVRCEAPIGGKTGGDHKRLDFVLRAATGQEIALEVKWVRTRSTTFENDISKLKLHARSYGSKGYLIVFWRSPIAPHLAGLTDYRSGKAVEWNTGKTSYSARWFRIA